MIQVCKEAKTIRVCMGAGCKAWGADKILSVVKAHIRDFPELEDYQLRAEKCMSRCGGGASIRMSDKVFKARDMEKAVNILFQEQLSDTTA